MDLFQIVLITMQITTVFTKRYASSSGESIENLLYYKDCQKPKVVPTPPAPVPLRAAPPPAPRQVECPFPKMCCSMTCNNECGGGSASSMFGRETDGNPMFNMLPSPPHQPQQPVQPPINLRGRRKKAKPPLPPIGGRRDFGFTKERIKGLIAKDDDIRKILKDLVKVAMKKVDLVALINSKKTAQSENKKPEISISSDHDLEME